MGNLFRKHTSSCKCEGLDWFFSNSVAGFYPLHLGCRSLHDSIVDTFCAPFKGLMQSDGCVHIRSTTAQFSCPPSHDDNALSRSI